MSEIIIEQISSQDFDEMEKLYEASVKANPDGFIQDLTFHPNIKKLATDFTANRGTMIVLKEDSVIAGMGALRNNNEKQAMLCKLHVYKKHQGKGYGRKIVEALIKKAQDLNYEEIILDVTKSQKSAIALYQKVGFRIYEEKLFEVNVKGKIEPYDCYLMSLNLLK